MTTLMNSNVNTETQSNVNAEILRDDSLTHVIVIGGTGAGHMGPTMSLATFLAAGDSLFVTLVIPLQADDKVPDAAPEASGRFEIIRVLVPGDKKDPLSILTATSAGKDGMVSDVIAQCDLSNRRTAAVVYDMFSVNWAVLLATTINAPHFLFNPAPLTFLWCSQHWDELSELRNRGRAQVEEDVTDAFCIPPPIVEDMPFYIPGIRNAFFGSDLMEVPRAMDMWIRELYTGFRQCDGIIVHDLPEMYSHPRPLLEAIVNNHEEVSANMGLMKKGPCTIHPVGALALFDRRLNPVMSQEAPEIEWLNGRPEKSVVFVALGSWCQIPVADIIELARGLEDSGLTFLWAYRNRTPSMIPLMERECPEEVDESGLPTTFRNDVQGVGVVQAWVNQPAVLQHPAISCFVTHCGWNSTMEALSLGGMPLACLPISAEQGVNANLLEQEFGCGRRLWAMERNRKLSRTKVTEIVKDCAANDSLRMAAQRIKIALQAAAKQGGSACRERELFSHMISQN